MAVNYVLCLFVVETSRNESFLILLLLLLILYCCKHGSLNLSVFHTNLMTTSIKYHRAYEK